MQALAPLSSSRSIESLGLDNTKITDDGLKFLEGLELSHLSLHGCQITDGGIQKHLTQLSKLRSLRLSDTAITDRGLAALEVLPSLEYLTVQETRVTQAGLDHFKKTRPRCRLTPRSILPSRR